MKKQDQADELLRLLDEMQRVEGDPWLYERVQARLQATRNVPNERFRMPEFVVWGAVCLLLLFNTWYLWRPQGRHESPGLQQALNEYYLENKSDSGMYSY